MAKKKKELGSIKRVGVRYGRSTRHKVATIEHTMRNTTKCPYCNKDGVKRVAVGIWECKKCLAKFTAGAYTIKKKIAVKPQEV